MDKLALPEPNLNNQENILFPSTALEQRLITIWREILKKDNVGIADDFFKIGGTSLSAMQACYRMGIELACDVKVSDLFRYKTISKIIKQGMLERKSDNSCITLLSGTTCPKKQLIFLVHGVGGNILSYYRIIKELEDHYNIYGIQTRGLYSEQKYFESYSQMINFYSDEVKNILKNHGTEKYHIIGWSYGVNIALELINGLKNIAYCKNAFFIDGIPVANEGLKNLNFKTNNKDLSSDLKILILFYQRTYKIQEKICAISESELFNYAHQLLGYPCDEKNKDIIEKRVKIALQNMKNLWASFPDKMPLYDADKFHIIKASQTKHQKIRWNKILNANYVNIINIKADHWSIMTSDKLLNYLKCQLDIE